MRRQKPVSSGSASRLTKSDRRRIAVLTIALAELGRVLIGNTCRIRKHIEAHKRFDLSSYGIDDFEAKFLAAMKGGVIRQDNDPILTARLVAWVAWYGSKEHLALVKKITKARELARVNTSEPQMQSDSGTRKGILEDFHHDEWREQD